MRLSIINYIYLLFFLFICSCQDPRHPGPSTLVIAIEGLSGSNFACHPYEETEHSGFQILCNEAIRFTHAFTPSPLSQAGIGALLTGNAPLLNGLRDNGTTFLNAKTITLAEKLLKKDIRTFFIVSAPTIKRYSRLHQGFEIFHDEYDFSPKSFYRPISSSLQLFKNWVETDYRKQSFFGVIHVADLLFPSVATQTELLETRPKGIDGQFEEIDENLFLLISFLKQKKLWDKMYVILTGLNGHPNLLRLNEYTGTNLFSENVSIPLFIKPIKGREEIPLQWKIDSHVLLQDVGVTIEEIYNNFLSITNDHNPLLFGHSLISILNGKKDSTFQNRTLLIESSWASWSSNYNPRYSLRNDQWLYLFDQRPALYNTVTDRNEFNKVSSKDSSYYSIVEQFNDTLATVDATKHIKLPLSIGNTFRVAQIISENESRSLNSFFQDLKPYIESELTPKPIRWLLTIQLLAKNNIEKIQFLNSFWKDDQITSFLKIKNNEPVSYDELNPCIKFTLNNNTSLPHASIDEFCDSKSFLTLNDFLYANEDKKDFFLDKLIPLLRLQNFQLKMIHFDFSRGGIILGGNVDVLEEILWFRMILNLKPFQKEKAILDKKVGI